jgi:coproporphyrinogen III oxidase-like Fe-S oxidoreductase
MKNWIGIGPAASGTIIDSDGTGRRVSYVPDTEAFCDAVHSRITPPVVVEDLDRAAVVRETLLMGYRYCEGPDPVLFKRRFGKTLEETIPRTLAAWQNGAGNRERIMNFLNSFLLDAFLELDTEPE